MRLVLHIQDSLLHFCKSMCFSYDRSGLFNQYNQPNYIQRTGLMGPSHSLHWHLHMSNIGRAVRYSFTSFSNLIQTCHSPFKCSACLFVPHITFAVAFSLIFCAWIYPENRFKKKSQAVISGHQAWNCTFTNDSMGQPGILRSERVLAVKHYCLYSHCNSHARDGWCSRGEEERDLQRNHYS